MTQGEGGRECLGEREESSTIRLVATLAPCPPGQHPPSDCRPATTHEGSGTPQTSRDEQEHDRHERAERTHGFPGEHALPLTPVRRPTTPPPDIYVYIVYYLLYKIIHKLSVSLLYSNCKYSRDREKHMCVLRN